MAEKNFILFDWDGCLARTLDVWLKVYKNVVARRGIEVENDLDFVEKTFGKWEKGFENVGVKDSVKAYKEALTEAEKKLVKVELYPNAKEVLTALKNNGKKLALLTSSFKHLVIPAIAHNGLEDMFDYVITKNDTEIPKPDPWIIDTALKHLGGKHMQAIMIGDSDHDVLLAKNAKVTSVLYFPEDNKKFYREEYVKKYQPDHVIKDLMDLTSIAK